MSIVLNEREWAESTIRNHELGKSPRTTLNRIAKYYSQIEGYKKRDIIKKLEYFLLQCDPNIRLPRWSGEIEYAAKNADKYPLIQIDHIDVTREEIMLIDGLGKRQLCRLAFTLLCVAKYWNRIHENNNNWVNSPDKELMQMANIRTSTQRQSRMFNTLMCKGLVTFSKRVDSLNIRVNYVYEDSPGVLRVSDFRNLGNQYMMRYGGPYFPCVNCGLIIPKKGNAQKYCPECAAEIHSRNTIESVTRNRAKLFKI